MRRKERNEVFSFLSAFQFFFSSACYCRCFLVRFLLSYCIPLSLIAAFFLFTNFRPPLRL